MRATSSADARYSIATTASAMISAARAPIICTPKISSVVASASTFAKPSTSPDAIERPRALNGNEPSL